MNRAAAPTAPIDADVRSEYRFHPLKPAQHGDLGLSQKDQVPPELTVRILAGTETPMRLCSPQREPHHNGDQRNHPGHFDSDEECPQHAAR